MVNKRDMRISSTHDLAEFLRCSKPEDYSRPSKTVDDLALEAGHRKLSFKFLKTTSKEFLSPRKNTIPVPVPSTVALPEKVRPEKTSKGNSYLAIQVDYTPIKSDALITSIWTPSPSTESNRDSIRNATSAEFSSERSNYRSSIASQIWKEHDSSFQSDYDSYTRGDSRVSTRWMRHSSGSELSSPRAALLAPSRRHGTGASTAPAPPPKPNRRNGVSSSHKYVQLEESRSISSTSTSSPRNFTATPPAVQRRYSSDSTPRATLVPVRKGRESNSLQRDSFYGSLSPPEKENASPVPSKPSSNDLDSTLKPARPGPPPNRGLPSLPEGHGDAINLASRIRAAAAARSSIGSQISLVSEAGSLKSRRGGPPSRSRSEREITVKARKLKDLEDLKARRSNSRSGSGENSESMPRARKPQSRSKKHQDHANASTFSPITVIYQVAPQDDNDAERDITEPARCSTCELSRRRSISSAASSEALPSQTRKSLDSSHMLSSSVQGTNTTSRKSTPIVDNSASLEARVQNMERRNHLLEQALLAVLRGAIYKDNGNDMEGPGLAEVVKCLADVPAYPL
ncbi:hypothetical protein ABW19_dt0203682 [Dactylella cylindrospora]|nr:hypothetical protein ABW19_dt0203682 [Dactylella cylindrospora]